jgi:hypothetical protein
MFKNLTLSAFIIVLSIGGCDSATKTMVPQELLKNTCEAYKFDFKNISEINIPSEPFKLITNKNGIKTIENQMLITYNEETYQPIEAAIACQGFVAKGYDVQKLPDNCFILISPEVYWSKNPDCATVGKYEKISKNCYFLCSKNKCYSTKNNPSLYEDSEDIIPEFDTKTGIPLDYYDDNNVCGHKHFRP